MFLQESIIICSRMTIIIDPNDDVDNFLFDILETVSFLSICNDNYFSMFYWMHIHKAICLNDFQNGGKWINRWVSQKCLLLWLSHGMSVDWSLVNSVETVCFNCLHVLFTTGRFGLSTSTVWQSCLIFIGVVDKQNVGYGPLNHLGDTLKHFLKSGRKAAFFRATFDILDFSRVGNRSQILSLHTLMLVLKWVITATGTG